MDVVLDMAHKLDDSGPTSQNTIPSKERIIDTVIFTLNDVVSISALNVDLDYATKGEELFPASKRFVCTTEYC